MTAPRIRGSPYRHRAQLPIPHATGAIVRPRRSPPVRRHCLSSGLVQRVRVNPACPRLSPDDGRPRGRETEHLSWHRPQLPLPSWPQQPRFGGLRAATTPSCCRGPWPGELGRFVVDATWGTIMPIMLAPGVRTVGEREVLEHIAAGLPLVDTRLPAIRRGRNAPDRAFAGRTRSCPPGSTNSIASVDTILFCNGPQCVATSDAIRAAAQRRPSRGAPALLPRRDPRLGHARPANRTRRRAASTMT